MCVGGGVGGGRASVPARLVVIVVPPQEKLFQANLNVSPISAPACTILGMKSADVQACKQYI